MARLRIGSLVLVAVCALGAGEMALAGPLGRATAPVGRAAGTVTNTVGGVTSNTVGTATGTVGGVTDSVGNVATETIDTVTDTVGDVTDTIGGVTDKTLGTIGGLGQPGDETVGRPRARADAIVRDPTGARAVRGRVLALSPSVEALMRARAFAFEVVGEDNLPALGLRVVTLRIPANLDTDAALALLRAGDPGGAYDYDHLYDPSGNGKISTAAASIGVASAAAGAFGPIGMIDGGVRTTHPVLASALITARNCMRPSAGPATQHGTQIASLLVGYGNGFSGAAPGHALFAADVFGGAPTGGDAVAMARAFAWLADQNVVAINVSLVGPANRIVEAAVRSVIARGTVVVAAVGNNGAAGRTAFPAGYPGVIGVTAVDETNAAQIDANRGRNVTFAARGVDVVAADLSGRLATVTGTSYAVPVVTARFALALARPDRRAVYAILARLKSESIDLGPPGWDPIYGFGLIQVRGQPMTAGPASTR